MMNYISIEVIIIVEIFNHLIYKIGTVTIWSYCKR